MTKETESRREEIEEMGSGIGFHAEPTLEEIIKFEISDFIPVVGFGNYI